MKNKKVLFCGLIIACILILVIVVSIIINKTKNEDNSSSNNEMEQKSSDTSEYIENNIENNIDIIDVNSKTRPYAIVINNTPVAVKVQTGLNKAYLIYEIPTEGNTSRLMALYKDIEEDLTIGTIRSARHNFIDLALESDAILIHYGWSRFAKADEEGGAINYINGLFDKPFWRNNPENLASEHTAYTSIAKIKQTIEEKKFVKDSDNTVLLKYSGEDVNLAETVNNKIANKVIIPYGSESNTTSFVYDAQTKMYNRVENGKYCFDYYNKENVNTKNIIIQKIDYEAIKNSKYWNLKTIGSGKGYFITNGYAVPITWKKDSRKEKTKYFYENGEEIKVSDGRTYIEIQTNNQNLTIE